MDSAAIQKVIYKGYSQAADVIGKTALQYRPLSPLAPIGMPLNQLPVSFTVNMDYSKFNKYGVAIWTALVDGSLTRVGDYLTTPDGTWFIAAQQPA
jgi:hypothetical protein